MQKNKKIILSIIAVFFMIGTIMAMFAVNGTVGSDKAYFNGVIKEVQESQVLVEPEKGTFQGSTDAIWITLNTVSPNLPKNLKVGDTIRIVYDGMIQETYPAQINGAYAIYLIKDGEILPNN